MWDSNWCLLIGFCAKQMGKNLGTWRVSEIVDSITKLRTHNLSLPPFLPLHIPSVS